MITPSHDKIAILGNGQLAKMLKEAGHKLGLSITALDNFTNLSDYNTAIFENEFVDTSEIFQIAPRTRYVPSLETIRTLSDKREQKKVFEKLNIPTARWIDFEKSSSISDWLQEVEKKFPKGAVLKLGKLGYDGKGVLTDFSLAKNFIEDALNRGLPFYAEEKIAFDRELAVIGVYSIQKEFVSYPLVQSIQKQGICFEVRGPLEERTDIPSWAEKIARDQNLYGAFGVECFQEGDKILVNEIAPRVHNSGHYTMDASETSQFENHLRAVLGMPLGSVKSKGRFLMRNVLGPKGVNTDDSLFPKPIPRSHSVLRWYDKKEVRPQRKIGHVNAVASFDDDVSVIENEVENIFLDWEKRVYGKKT